MPNWCENTVKFTGDKEKIARLLYRLTAPVKIVAEGYLAALSFDQPPWEYGEKFITDIPPGGHAMARTVVSKDKVDYAWMIHTLGTKWDFDIHNLEAKEGCIQGNFDSAWSPPAGWFTLVCQEYQVDGELSYGEGGCDFAGILENKGGAEVDYRSTYNPWAALRDSSHGEYLESLIEQLQDCGELPSDIDALRQEAASWPKSWEEYKRSYRRR
jgi:hypothetical protein